MKALHEFNSTGLYKEYLRIYFAGLAMQANADNDLTPEAIAEEAVKLADALIIALKEEV